MSISTLNGRVLGNPGIRPVGKRKAYKDYDLKLDYCRGLIDGVSKTPLPDANYESEHYNLINGELVTYGTDEYVRDADGRVLTCGGYTVLNGKTNDISDPYWGKSNALAPASNEFLATALYGNFGRSISTTEDTEYTLSFDAWVEPGGVLTNYSFRHSGSATGNSTLLTLTYERVRYSATVLGKSGGGLVTFGFVDNHTSNWSKIYIENINVTESPYPLPFVPNDTTGTVTVSATYADDNVAGDERGPRLAFADIPQGVDALDGVADGDELISSVATDWSLGTGVTYDEATGVFTFIATSELSIQDISAVVGNYYESSWEIIEYTSGNMRVRVGYADDGSVDKNFTDEFSERVTCGGNGLLYLAPTAFTGKIKINSIKQISPAQGTIVWKGRFGFDYDQVTQNSNIFAVSQNVLILSYFDSNGIIYIKDNTNTTQKVVQWGKDTDLTVTYRYGPHPDYSNALKMQIIITDGITTWDSVMVDFDGSFDPADFLWWGYKNPYPVWHESLEFKKEVAW